MKKKRNYVPYKYRCKKITIDAVTGCASPYSPREKHNK